MKKTLLALSVSLALLFSGFTSVFAKESSFFDVTSPQFDWAINEIEAMVNGGIIKGYPDGSFKPLQSIKKYEALILISRILGVNLEENKMFAEFASNMYADVLENYNTTYKTEIAYLLYQGVLDTAELPNYIGKNSSDGEDPLKRYEAAILIAKAMGAEDKILSSSSVGVVLPYSDSADIPSAAKPYVEYVTNEGLMKAMNTEGGINEFVPNFSVNRSQMAVMLYRMMKKLNIQIYTGIVTEVNKEMGYIKYRTADEEIKGHNVSDDTIVNIDGYPAELEDIVPGTVIAATLRSGNLYSLYSLSAQGDETVSGSIKNISVLSSSIKITVTDIDTETTKDIYCDKDVPVTYNGSPSSISQLKTGDYVSIEVKDSKGVLIAAQQKSVSVKGVVTHISFDPNFSLTITLADGSTAVYTTANSVSVKRNGSTATLRDVLVGDKVDITLTYGKISSITATSTSISITGVIESITISAQPSISIKTNDGKVMTYPISRDAKYTVEGVTSATIYDLRLGATITANGESGTITSITAKSVSGVQQITGTITMVNSAYGFFSVAATDGTTQQVFIKKTGAKIIDNTDDGKEKTIKNLKVGQTVTAVGSIVSGAFEASTIIIIAN